MRMSSVYDTLYSSLQVGLEIFSSKNIGQIILMKYACKIRVWEGCQLAVSERPKPKSGGYCKKLNLHSPKFACLMMLQRICQSGS